MATPPPQHGAGPYHHPYAPQQGGPQGPYGVPQQAGPYGHPPMPQAPYGCRVCGAGPAVQATVRGHQGMFVLMRFLRQEGPFCRDCGLATYRTMSADTLWQGWWGPLSVFITPVTVLLNLGARSRFVKLAPPAGGILPSLRPGKPLWRRPPALVFLAATVLIAFTPPLLVLLGLMAGDDELPTGPAVGTCVRDADKLRNEKLVPEACGSPLAKYLVTKQRGTDGADCADGDLISVPEKWVEGAHSLCLTPVH
ncbi:hypothetical protein [Streptomyces sp. A1547]|uniref:hypothetical protein n=1 Tax=Streptomyces sp. A1547 TaxID=2563105 RepID=UPI00061F56B0|nr:hypothetical protein [Streptomyces sp. A1547]KJY44164.1 hypothetical protein VR46_22075 [Streptomyces sp. NRRL S-444]